MRIGIPRESKSRERRVALTPTGVEKLIADNHSVIVEVGAGLKAGFTDEHYRAAGATVEQRAVVVGHEGIIAQINGPEADDLQLPEWHGLGRSHTLIALHDPLWAPKPMQALAKSGATIFSLELMPRITRAQSMDVLSSMATVAGYEAVLLASTRSQKMWPMMMTAAGTVPPARVLVLGAGVAGLQAIATAKRLGAVVEGYDIRPAAAEQIESLGAKSIKLDLDTGQAEGAGGYAQKQTDQLNERQAELLTPHAADADVIITTAAIPGAASPELITSGMVQAMKPGAIIIDLAAERGGNCRLTKADEEVIEGGVIILGPTDLVSRSAATSSQMFSNNVVTLLRLLNDEDPTAIQASNEIAAACIVADDGEIRNERVRASLGLAPVNPPATESPNEASTADGESMPTSEVTLTQESQSPTPERETPPATTKQNSDVSSAEPGPVSGTADRAAADQPPPPPTSSDAVPGDSTRQPAPPTPENP